MAGAWSGEHHRDARQRNGTGFDMRRLGRAVIMLGGGALSFYGLRRGGALGVCLASVGGVLAGAGMSRPLAQTSAEPRTGGAR